MYSPEERRGMAHKCRDLAEQILLVADELRREHDLDSAGSLQVAATHLNRVAQWVEFRTKNPAGLRDREAAVLHARLADVGLSPRCAKADPGELLTSDTNP